MTAWSLPGERSVCSFSFCRFRLDRNVTGQPPMLNRICVHSLTVIRGEESGPCQSTIEEIIWIR